jgi:hypothetical protein
VSAAANGQQPFDLDVAAEAALTDVQRRPFPFKYKGEPYEMPNAAQWPLEAQDLIGRGELHRAFAMLLGDETYKRLMNAGMNMGELTVLFQKVSEITGLSSLPNLPAPAQPGSTRT